MQIYIDSPSISFFSSFPQKQLKDIYLSWLDHIFDSSGESLSLWILSCDRTLLSGGRDRVCRIQLWDLWVWWRTFSRSYFFCFWPIVLLLLRSIFWRWRNWVFLLFSSWLHCHRNRSVLLWGNMSWWNE